MRRDGLGGEKGEEGEGDRGDEAIERALHASFPGISAVGPSAVRLRVRLRTRCRGEMGVGWELRRESGGG